MDNILNKKNPTSFYGWCLRNLSWKG